MANATSAEDVKVAYTEGVKKGSETQMHPLHSSILENEVLCYPMEYSPIMPSTESGLLSIHLLR